MFMKHDIQLQIINTIHLILWEIQFIIEVVFFSQR